MKLCSSITLVSILLFGAACGSSADDSVDNEKGSESGSKGPSTETSPAEPSPSSPSNPSDPPPSGTTPSSPCAAATKTLCARACACGTGGGCVIAYGANASVTEEHDSLQECETFYSVLVCGDAAAAAPYATDACKTAIEGASCMETKTKGSALSFPPACKGPQ